MSAVPAVSESWYNVNITLVMVPGDCTVLYCTGDGGCPPARRARPPDRLLPPGRAGPLPAERHQPGHGAGHRWVMERYNCNIDVVVWYSQYVLLKLVYLSTKPSLTGSNAEVLMGLLCKLYITCTLIRHFIKAWQNFRKARHLWYAEKLFWFMAKVLGFVICKWSASNEDFLMSSWIRQSLNLNFPPLEYVSDFEPGSLADQWQWSKVWVNQSQSTIYKWPLSDLPESTLCPFLSLSFTKI